MHNCVGEVLLLGIFAVTAYRDWKEQMICVYVPLAAGIAGLVLHLMLPTQKLIRICFISILLNVNSSLKSR